MNINHMFGGGLKERIENRFLELGISDPKVLPKDLRILLVKGLIEGRVLCMVRGKDEAGRDCHQYSFLSEPKDDDRSDMWGGWVSR